MLTQQTYTVNRITQQAVANANGTFHTSYIVNFGVGEHGPFTLQIPSDQFNADAVRARLVAFVDNLNAITKGA